MKKFDKLFEGFSQINTNEWEEQISKDLKGRDYETKLVWKTIEGINIKPYYRKENFNDKYKSGTGSFPFIRGNNNNEKKWLIKQDFCINDIESNNRNIINSINNGVNSIGIYTNNSQGYQYNKAFVNIDNFLKLINNIDIENISINNIGNNNASPFLSLLDEACEILSIDRNKVKGSTGYDPIGFLTTNGNFHDDEKLIFGRLASLYNYAKEALPSINVIDINGQYFHNAGSSIVQELAFSLTIAVEYLSNLTDNGLSIDDIAPKIQFNFAIGSDYFLEIAKYRAVRVLWAKIVKSYNPQKTDSAKMFIHALTSNWNKTIYDPYINILRTTTEAMSGIIGGIDALTINPFDNSYAEQNEFSDRVAKNQQLILKEEAHFDKVIDTAAGSYYVENITEAIIEETWKLFLEIENNGGYIKSFKNGIIQSKIKKTSNKRNMDIAFKKKVFLGTSQFPNQAEHIKNNIDENIVFHKHKQSENIIAEPLIIYRGAQEFEQLRLRTEKHTKTPKVFLFTYGNIAMRKARAGFASNFFACAGYKIIDNSGFPTIEEGIDDAIKSKAEIVVLCSSDDEYAETVPQIISQLKDKSELVLAGYPKEHIDKFKELGLTTFIHVKSNILETLKEFHNKLNIK